MADFFDRCPDDLAAAELKTYFASLLETHSWSTVKLDRCGLQFFYPRLSLGGVLISHDYRAISCPGVRKAFDEFLVDKPEKAIPLWDTQCFFVKGSSH